MAVTTAVVAASMPTVAAAAEEPWFRVGAPDPRTPHYVPPAEPVTPGPRVSRAAVAISNRSPQCDFNNDGYSEVVVPSPFEDLGAKLDAGAVTVLRGKAGGATTAGAQVWTQDSPGVAGGAEAGDQFGWRTACGDFDGDGYDDLAIGVPGEGLGSAASAGVVHVLYGTSTGLRATGNQLLHQGRAGAHDTPEAGDRFGWALIAGDFDGDGDDDLAVAAPNEDGDFADGDAFNVADRGLVQIYAGTPSGLVANGSWFGPGNIVNFGRALAAGDFSVDFYEALVFGSNSAYIAVVYGSATGLSTTHRASFSYSVAPGTLLEIGFGSALAVGDFDGNNYADLAVGAPERGTGFGGSVRVFYGANAGLSAGASELWYQGAGGAPGEDEAGDRFGYYLATGDFNGDGDGDLAIGVPRESIGKAKGVGAVAVLYGSATGLTTAGRQLWWQGRNGMPGVNQSGDQLGHLWASYIDTNKDGRNDLVIGTPLENIGRIVDAGTVHVMFGSGKGIISWGTRYWWQGRWGFPGAAERNDRLGVLVP